VRVVAAGASAPQQAMAEAAEADDAQVVFAWGAGEDGQLGLAEAPAGQDEWHVALPTVRAARTAIRICCVWWRARHAPAREAACALPGRRRCALAVP
jgi:hypothetical protein